MLDTVPPNEWVWMLHFVRLIAKMIITLFANYSSGVFEGITGATRFFASKIE